MKAKVSLTGRLTRDVTNVYSNDDGSAERAIFTVAVNSYFTDAKNATKKEVTDFIPCVDWSKSRIKLLKDWGRKGRLVHIEGSLDTFQAKPDEDGKYPPQKIQVRVGEFEFLDKKPEQNMSETDTNNTANGATVMPQNIDMNALAALVAKSMLGVVNNSVAAPTSQQESAPQQEEPITQTDIEAGLQGLV